MASINKAGVEVRSIICIFCKANIEYMNGDRQNYVNHLTGKHSINYYLHLVVVLNLTEKENLAAIIDMFGSPDLPPIPDQENTNDIKDGYIEIEKESTKEDIEKNKKIKQLQFDKVEEEMERMFREDEVADEIVKVSGSNNNNNKQLQTEIVPSKATMEEKTSNSQGLKVQKGKRINTNVIKNAEQNKHISAVSSKNTHHDEIEVIEVPDRQEKARIDVPDRQEKAQMPKPKLQMAKKSGRNKAKQEEGEVNTTNLNGHFLKCVLCNKIFLNQTYLRKHLIGNHMESEQEPDEELETVIDITEEDENICIDVDKVCEAIEGSTLDKLKDRVLGNNTRNKSIPLDAISKKPEDIKSTLGITSKNEETVETIEKDIVSLLGDDSGVTSQQNESKNSDDSENSVNSSLAKGSDQNINSKDEAISVTNNDLHSDNSKFKDKQNEGESVNEESSLTKNSSEEKFKSQDGPLEDGHDNLETGCAITSLETPSEKSDSKNEQPETKGDKTNDCDGAKIIIESEDKSNSSEVGFKTVEEVKLVSVYFKEHPKQIQKLTNHENLVDTFCDVDSDLPDGWRVSKKTSKQGYSNKIYLAPDAMIFRSRKAALEYAQLLKNTNEAKAALEIGQLLKNTNEASTSNSSQSIEDQDQTSNASRSKAKSNTSENSKTNKRKRLDVEDNLGDVLEKDEANTGDNDEEYNIDTKIMKTTPDRASSEGRKELQIFQRSFKSAAEVKKVSAYFREHPKQIKRIIASDEQISNIFTDVEDDLPPGWRVGSKLRPDGNVDRLYLSPDFMSFRSRKAVGEYIKLQIVVQ